MDIVDSDIPPNCQAGVAVIMGIDEGAAERYS